MAAGKVAVIVAVADQRERVVPTTRSDEVVSELEFSAGRKRTFPSTELVQVPEENGVRRA